MAFDLLFTLVASAFVAVLLWRRIFVDRGGSRSRLPPELQGASLVYAEQLFRSNERPWISARVDRVYLNAQSQLVPIELKTRSVNRIYQSDVIELSAQRIALEVQTGHPVARHGYVLIQSPDGRSLGFHKVTLLSSQEVKELAVRHAVLATGGADARRPPSSRICSTCVYREVCSSTPWKHR